MTARRALKVLAAASTVTTAGIAVPSTAFAAPTDTCMIDDPIN